eukprot:gene2812-28594_t
MRATAIAVAATAAGAGGCATSLDCSLNGACRGGACACDPAWEGSCGPACGRLRLRPARLTD